MDEARKYKIMWANEVLENFLEDLALERTFIEDYPPELIRRLRECFVWKP